MTDLPPMDELEYVESKLRVAVTCLAASAAPLRERLINAWLDAGLGARNFRAGSFERRAEWYAIESAVRAVDGSGNELGIHASIRALTDEEARQMAEGFVMLHGGICRERGSPSAIRERLPRAIARWVSKRWAQGREAR